MNTEIEVLGKRLFAIEVDLKYINHTAFYKAFSMLYILNRKLRNSRKTSVTESAIGTMLVKIL